MLIKISANKIEPASFGNNIPDKSGKEIKNRAEVSKQTEIRETSPVYNVKTPLSYRLESTIKMPNGIIGNCYKLSNGQKVIIVPKEGETTIRTFVNTGSMNEPDNLRGISHFIEHNLFNGSEGLKSGEFFQKVHEMGGDTNASTCYSSTNYYISSNLLNKEDFEDMVKLHASMLETPRFAPEMLDKEKGIISSEINMITQNPENINVNKAIKNLYNIKTSSTDMIGGTCENIANLTREDVTNYYNNNYYPANMATVITGNIKPEEAITLVSKYFSSKKVPNKPQKNEVLAPIKNVKREDLMSNKATATYMTVAFDGPKNNDLKERLTLDATFEALIGGVSSKINSKLKDTGCNVEGYEERISTKPDGSTVRIFNASGTDNDIEKALKTIFYETQNFSLSAEELERIKKTAIKEYLMSFDNNFGINSRIGAAFLNNNSDEIQKYEEIINSLTIDDIKNCVNKYINPNKFSIVLTHPSKTSTEDSIKKNYSKVNFTGSEEKEVEKTTNLQTTTKLPSKEIEAINLKNLNAYNLKNNIRLVTNENNSQIGYINFDLKSNDLNQDDSVESALLSSMLEKGTMNESETDFWKSIKDNTIYLSVGAINNKISINSNFYTKDIDKVFEKMTELLYSPRLTQENLDIVKKNFKDAILIKEKSAYDKLSHEIIPKSFGGMEKEELLKKIDNIKLEDIQNFYKKLISESQGIITLTGPIKDTDFYNKIIKNVSNLPPVKPYEYKLGEMYKANDCTKVLTDTDNKPQAEVLETYIFKDNDNIKDNVTINLLNKILGSTPSSRLFLDLREKQQLAYRVNSELEFHEDMSALTLGIGTTTENRETGEVSYDNIKKSIEGFNKHIEKLKREKVTESELNNAKLDFKNSILSKIQTAEDKNSMISDLSYNPYGLSYLNEKLKLVDQITPDDIYNAANYIFKNKPYYSILATKNTIDANKDYLKSLENS